MTCAGAHELTLDVAAGERVALSGRDQATATALLRAVAGLNPVGGRGSRTPAERAWRARACAWLPRRPVPARSQARAADVLARSAHPAAAAFAAGLLGVAELTNRPLHGLTPGEIQRLHWARVIGCVTAGAGVLLADEPAEGLEPDDCEALVLLLAELPVTLLLATADPVLTALCDRRVGTTSDRPGAPRTPLATGVGPKSLASAQN
ncbi:ABC transporter ATP-binding protein [Streptomyces sp. C1-2]|uniref:ABC transporter ATP-binding protein n=1 Tax=Streptomyces sp. C1-2 TaxID=2720022 RepID=UPI001432315C|nr:ABC transporter ATP-binding protein [Streptomyces sp. C1-2]NJP70926.1 ABC transporter ATP-binding protein [Streptomyces sp. C1-2]